PYRTQLKEADMDFIIAATHDNIMMVEGESKECQEADVVKALELAHEAIRAQIKLQADLRDKAGVKGKREVAPAEENEELKKRIGEFASARITAIAQGALPKHERSEGFKKVHEDFEATLTEEEKADDTFMGLVKKYFYKLEKKLVRDMVLDTHRRLD